MEILTIFLAYVILKTLKILSHKYINNTNNRRTYFIFVTMIEVIHYISIIFQLLS